MIIYLPLLVLIIGLLMFILCKNGIASEIGKISFGVGLFIFLWHCVPSTVSFLR